MIQLNYARQNVYLAGLRLRVKAFNKIPTYNNYLILWIFS